ncbi:MAG: PQQ-binding-like beta-propeller repeat protein [Planctomycetales bacterium]|nr:PQQ-binding-like beta-propeller repeat protein [Planctomycetales bacterium]
MTHPIEPLPLAGGVARRRTAYGRIVQTIVLVVIVTVGATRGAAQELESVEEGVQPVTQRQLSRGIERAEERLAAGEFSQALRFLDELLGREDDYFVAVGDEGKFVGLKARAAAALRSLPPAGREAYEAAFGPIAQRELDQVVATGDAAALRRLVQRYFFTSAGQQAALLLARLEQDSGRRLAAALLYDRILAAPEARQRFDPQLSTAAALAWEAAGQSDRAAEILGAAPQGREQIAIAGRPEPPPQGDDALNRLTNLAGTPIERDRQMQENWLTFRGNLQRNAGSQGGLPHMRLRWQVRTLPHPELEETYEELAADLRQSRRLTPVAARPLAVGDILIARTPHTLYGIDFTTGKLLWQAEPVRSSDLEQLLPREPGAEGDGEQSSAAAMAFATRIWQDSLFAEMSSDGERVYAVRGLPAPVGEEIDAWRGGPFGGDVSFGSEATNRLCAYSLAKAGRRAWQVDGADVDGPLPGAFFLGAPLVVGQTAYAVVDMRDEVSLVAIAADSGELLWRQPLASLDYFIAFDQQRRLQASMPSYADGMLVCPTGGGIVIGFDLSSQSLAWAYQYKRREASPRYPRRVDDSETSGSAGRWSDSTPTIVDGRVLLTPPEANELHCLDLRTGELLWKRDRNDMLSVACVTDGRVVMIGNQKATALNLADGKPTWKSGSLRWPDNALPTGSGFLSAGLYFVPLSTAEVVAFDVKTGELAARSASRDGKLLGNLICHRGAVLSQTGRYLERFDQIDALRTNATAALAQNPNDVDALRTLGEVAMSEDRRSEAIDLLERAYLAAPDDGDVCDVLAEALSEALLADFASYRAKLPLLERLQDGTVRRRLTLQRILAQGMLQVGEAAEAADACLAIYRDIGEHDEPLLLGLDYTAAPSRWLSAQIAAVYEACDDQQRAGFLEKLQPLLREAVDDEGGAQTARYLACFGTLPGSAELRLARAARLSDQGQDFAGQLQLLPLLGSDDPLLTGQAARRIDADLRRAGQQTLADQFWQHYATSMPDAAPTAEPEQGLAPPVDLASLGWPQGRTKATVRTTTADETRYGRGRLPMFTVPLERGDAILDLANISIGTRSSEFVVRDSLGRALFEATFPGDMGVAYREPGTAYAVTHGSLLIVSLGQQIIALNTLADKDDPAGSVLWQANAVSGLDRRGQSVESGMTSWNRPGSYRPPRAVVDSQWIGVIGPVTSSGVVLQDQRRLMCLDPLTGEVLWQRADVAGGCDLYGDDQLVFVVPKASRRARVYSAVDGRDLGQRAVPSWREQLATRGRVVIAWQRRADGFEMTAVDPWTEETLWSHRFARDARVDVQAGEVAAVVEPSGRVVAVDLATGALAVDYAGPPISDLEEVHLIVGSDALTVVASRRDTGGDARRIRPFNLFDYAAVDGLVYAFRRSDGEMCWNQPAEVVRQALMVHQGGDLPVVAFASGLTTRNRSGSRAVTTMLLLDKATGRTIYRTDDLKAAAGGYCQPQVGAVDEDGRPTLEVEMNNRTVSLAFSDAPRPPAPPAMAEVEAGSRDSRGGLTRLLFNGIKAAE